MLIASIQLIAGIALLYFGADRLVKGSSSLAFRMGLSPLIIGMTIVAFGTSAPELVATIEAALSGRSGIAVGNVVGSNICNIALVLGVAALIHPVRTGVILIQRDIPILIVISIIAGVMLYDDTLYRTEGMVLIALLILHLFYSITVARQGTTPFIETEFEDVIARKDAKPMVSAFYVALGIGLLVPGASLFIDGASMIGREFGLGEAVIGLSIVAFGTSLPELATTVLAAVRQESDIAIGNVVGSSIFNILGILGITTLISPIEGSGVAIYDVGLMIVLSVLLIPLAWTGFKIDRFEGGILVIVYVVYMTQLVW
jgi:cation:H+ antiporter